MLIITLFAQYDFTIARLKYSGGGDWYSNPSSLPNLLEAINERTTIRAAPREENVEITDPKLFQYPYLYMTGHGKVRFSDEEVKILRMYFAAGGFLHADDNYGMDSTFRREIEKVFPDSPLIELPFLMVYQRFMNTIVNLLKALVYSTMINLLSSTLMKVI
jgi:hypothetical protein